MLEGHIWAMEPGALDALLSQDIRALMDAPQAKRRRPYQIDGRTALIQISGALMPGSDRFSFFGISVTGYAWIADTVRAADGLDDVDDIILIFNSGGGVACAGIQDAVDAIRGTSKPVSAYVYGACCSAAMPLAMAADSISASPMAQAIGCLGSMCTIRRIESGSGVKVVEHRFVSKLTPRKNAPPETKEGAEDWQKLVDDSGEAFLSLIGDLRNISGGPDAVAEKFGRGRAVSPVEALEMGLVDRIEIMNLAGSATTTGGVVAEAEDIMSKTTETADSLLATARAQLNLITDERDKFKAEAEKWESAAKAAQDAEKASIEAASAAKADVKRLHAELKAQKDDATRAEAEAEFDKLHAAGDFTNNEREGFVKAYVNKANGNDELFKYGFEARIGQGLAGMGVNRDGSGAPKTQTHGAGIDKTDMQVKTAADEKANVDTIEADMQAYMTSTGATFTAAIEHFNKLGRL